jgi:class 3 adenylate cyclase/predicted ATPase
MDISAWLRGLGLERYGQAFRENAIDEASLPKLTAEDLRDLGVTAVGHRRILLDAIAALRAETPLTIERSVEPDRSYSKASEGERRQLTVMFADLVGSTALSARLDPEELRDVIGAYHRRCAVVITSSGGFVAKYLGDGVLAYFGYPQAHEEDAERAVRAGLALIDAVAKLDAGHATTLRVRIGIATGLVVVGDLLGEGAAQEQAVIGETPNLAARLQGLAEPNTVVIADDTRRMLGGLFDYRDLGALPIAGIDHPLHVWRVLGASLVGSRFEALRSASTPLIGREEEIALLTRRWERAKAGDGSVVLIVGEPGIGKSRIAQTLLEQLGKEPHTHLRYFCSPHHQNSALYPSIAQLERAAGFRREDTDEQRLEKLEAILAQGTNDLREAVPLLADLLNIQTGERYPPLNFTPQKRKERTLLAQLTQVEGLAAQQPVLMVFEDVHWSDPTTRESLDLLIDRVLALRVLVIITFRPEFTPPWIGRPHVTLLSLSRLPPRQRAEMITHVTGGKALPKEIADQIVDRTDGVPLFIEELTRTVMESGILADAGDRYTTAGPVAPFAIPTSLHASLLARLDRLAPAREVAQIGAALGRSFSHELISAVAPMPRHYVDDALAQLVGAELIFRRGTPPDAEYTFKHVLVQDAAYGTLLRSRRHQIHARIATALEVQFPEIVAAQPALLAHHCTEAGLPEKAVRYRTNAGHQAMARSAMIEAEAQLSKGLDLLAALPEETGRQQHELGLQIALGMALIATRGYVPAVGEAFTRARQLCDQLDQPAQASAVMSGQCIYYTIRGELARACQVAKELLEFGEARNDRDATFQGCASSALTWFHIGDFVAARAHAERALALYDPAFWTANWTVSPQSYAGMFLFRSLTYLGYLDQARFRRDEHLGLARKQAHAHTLAMQLGTSLACDVHMRRDAASLLSISEQLGTLCADHGFPYWGALSAWGRGCCLSISGRQDQAIALITEALNAYQAIGAVTVVPLYLTSLAEALGKAGRLSEGLEKLNEATRQIEATQEGWTEADMHRVRGELLIAIGDLEAAEQSFHQAIAVARRQSAYLWELRAATSLARLWRDQGKRNEARDLLAPIYGWFTEGFDTPDLKEAKALLQQLKE